VQPIISVSSLSKTYASGFQALKKINLEIRQGEIFGLLGPNGAGKTTLINIICGIVNPTGGAVMADGHDVVRDFRAARSKIGLVPQELSTDAFETVRATVSFSRGLFGKPANPAHIEKVLKDLSLWDKKDSQIRTLSGGMKRRVMIAKALSHEPQILFLDEPTAGVDVEPRLRWACRRSQMISNLRPARCRRRLVQRRFRGGQYCEHLPTSARAGKLGLFPEYSDESFATLGVPELGAGECAELGEILGTEVRQFVLFPMRPERTPGRSRDDWEGDALCALCRQEPIVRRRSAPAHPSGPVALSGSCPAGAGATAGLRG
jgi:ABC-type Na+ transport system ATPase subunit NatA